MVSGSGTTSDRKRAAADETRLLTASGTEGSNPIRSATKSSRLRILRRIPWKSEQHGQPLGAFSDRAERSKHGPFLQRRFLINLTLVKRRREQILAYKCERGGVAGIHPVASITSHARGLRRCPDGPARRSYAASCARPSCTMSTGVHCI
jgi:hypothetical protein